MISAVLLMIIPLMLEAQRPAGSPLKQESRDRIEAQRIAFITQKLRLTPEESAKFWPVYNEYKDAIRDMRDDIERPDLMNISDEQAMITIERHLDLEQKRVELKRNLFTKLRNVIGPRKILMLHNAEKEFNRELLRRANEFRRD